MGGDAAAPETDGPAAEARSERRRWLVSVLYPSLFLVFLAFPIVAGWAQGGWRGPAGTILALVFAAWYTAGLLVAEAPARSWGLGLVRRAGPAGWLVLLTLLGAALTSAVGGSGLVFLTYVAAGAGATLSVRVGPVVIAAVSVAMGVGVRVTSESWPWAVGLGAWVGAIGLIVWAGAVAERGRDASLAAREEKAELAVEIERARVARDLHDILGHSLTVITVKAELAGRLLDVDPERARAEIADVERLSRDALADVRTTVSEYRKLSLPGELARARRALDAAGIDARLPGAADDVPTPLRDLFAWVVREGVTNVVRHSRAQVCEIELTPASVEVRDDGPAAAEVLPGNGLTGLRERARQVGATIVAGPREPHGFLLRASAGTDPREGR